MMGLVDFLYIILTSIFCGVYEFMGSSFVMTREEMTNFLKHFKMLKI